MKQILLCGIILLTVRLSLTSVASTHECKRTCQKNERPRVCVYNFTVEWYRTLSKACYDCPFNHSDCFRPDCVSGDGRIKPLIAVNRQVPGPSIEVCEGDRVVVWVTNDMEDGQATSIHWHGQHQTGTPYSDGVGHITQCNIGVKETFKYEFTASPAGTHWYHGHTGMQLADGLFGAFIVRQHQDVDPNGALYDVDDHIMVVGDWKPVTSMTRYVDLMHDLYDMSLPQGLHINGRARKVDVPNKFNIVKTNLTTAKTPMEVFEVTRGQRYRLRVIGASGNCPLLVAVEKHQLQVIANDGMPVQPRPVDVFLVFPGERYDFLLFANQDVGNYWVKVVGLSECRVADVSAAAILRYAGAPDEDPSTALMFSTAGGVMLNPVPRVANDIYGRNHIWIRPVDLRSARDVDLTKQTVDTRLYIGMEFNNNDNQKYNNKKLYSTSDIPPRKGHFTPVMDNITFFLPPIPLLSQPEDVDDSWFCNRSTVTDSDKCLTDLCLCTHTLRFKQNEIVELVIINEAKAFQELGHPMHLHGHSFYIMGEGKFNKKSTSRAEVMRLDQEGQIPRNYINPPYRDTINVRDAGYVILRFQANNPGFWFFHCHTDSHLAQGKALLVQIGEYKDFPPIPSTFPKCGGWGYSNAKRKKGERPCVTSGAAQHSAGFLATISVAMVACRSIGAMIHNYL
ncbi:laccase-1-like isoform X1 [Haliotis rufescens]|uniref:laccase-1-like isoform X1 n=1 Tax=Haliotis rufescens TaxID=6454 RepID=UPI00201E8A99|nr:laccase-1-like isoform X1 [Haliotis rufescens]